MHFWDADVLADSLALMMHFVMRMYLLTLMLQVSTLCEAECLLIRLRWSMHFGMLRCLRFTRFALVEALYGGAEVLAVQKHLSKRFCEADVLADSLALVDALCDALVLADSDALVDALAC